MRRCHCFQLSWRFELRSIALLFLRGIIEYSFFVSFFFFFYLCCCCCCCCFVTGIKSRADLFFFLTSTPKMGFHGVRLQSFCCQSPPFIAARFPFQQQLANRQRCMKRPGHFARIIPPSSKQIKKESRTIEAKQNQIMMIIMCCVNLLLVVLLMLLLVVLLMVLVRR